MIGAAQSSAAAGETPTTPIVPATKARRRSDCIARPPCDALPLLSPQRTNVRQANAKGKRCSHPISDAVHRKIEHEDTRVAAGGPLKHLGMAQRWHRIAIAGEPTFLNRLAGEFFFFGRAFGACRPVTRFVDV